MSDVWVCPLCGKVLGPPWLGARVRRHVPACLRRCRPRWARRIASAVRATPADVSARDLRAIILEAMAGVGGILDAVQEP